MTLAIIGGTGFSELPGFIETGRVAVETPYGQSSSDLVTGEFNGNEITLLFRHGPNGHIPPHRVNYRANIAALKQHGVTEIIAINAVGGIHNAMAPAELCLPDQLIDYTSGREHTFEDADDTAVHFVDFTEPYSSGLRNRLAKAAAGAGISLVANGTMGVTNGPRLETAAEIDRMERDGCTVVGMTGMPEAGLARELGVQYASLAVSVNWAAGRGSAAGIHAEIETSIALGMQRVFGILERY